MSEPNPPVEILIPVDTGEIDHQKSGHRPACAHARTGMPRLERLAFPGRSDANHKPFGGSTTEHVPAKQKGDSAKHAFRRDRETSERRVDTVGQ